MTQPRPGSTPTDQELRVLRAYVRPGIRWAALMCLVIGHRWGDWGSGMDEPDGGRMCRRCWRIEGHVL